MKRPLVVVAIGYIIGIVWGLYCNCSIALLYGIIFLCYYIAKINKKKTKEFKLISFKRYFRYIKIVLKFSVIITIIISSLISNIIVIKLNNKYNTLYSNIKEELQIVGAVVSNAQEKEYKKVYKIKVESLNNNTKFKGTYLLLNVSNKIKTQIEYGDKINIIGSFQEPNTQRNYKGFDYKEYLKTQKVYGTVKVNSVQVVGKHCNFFILETSNKLFLEIKQKIENTFPNEYANLLLGIMMGYKDSLNEDIKEEFQDSNLSHILAVSGMHISYIVLGVVLVLEKGLGKRKTRICVCFILLIYMCITGFSPSVVRATIMGEIMLLSYIIHRKNDTWTSISISILVILIYNPYLITSISVLLSYFGTIGIILFSKPIVKYLENIKIHNKKYKYKINPKITKTVNIFKEAIAVTVSAQIAIAPIIIVCFNTAGIAFLLTNIVVSFIIGPIVILRFYKHSYFIYINKIVRNNIIYFMSYVTAINYNFKFR